MRHLTTLFAGLALAGCAGSTITPNYQSTNTEALRIGGKQPPASEPLVENMGSYCLQTMEVWHQDGKTPDGQALWTKDSKRNIVPCSS